MSIDALNTFVDKVANDEAFREAIIADPAGELSSWDLSQEELESIKSAPAWAWLRELWAPPANW